MWCGYCEIPNCKVEFNGFKACIYGGLPKKEYWCGNESAGYVKETITNI